MVEKNDSHDDVIKRFEAELRKSLPEKPSSSEKSEMTNNSETEKISSDDDRLAEEWGSFEKAITDREVSKYDAENDSEEETPVPTSKPLNKAVEDVKEGDVSSLASEKVVYGAARNALISKQERDFEKLKGIQPDVSSEKKDEVSSEFEKAKAEWSAARANARKLEEEYRTKYKAHILEQSKGLRGLVNLPRRMLGFQPSSTDELKALEGASLIARRNHKEAGKTLKEIKKREGSLREDSANPRKDTAKRYERMLAYHLVVGTQKRRLEAQQDAIGEAWGGSKFKPVMEALDKHKYARIGAMTLGYGVLAGATGGLAAAAYGGGAYLARIGVAMGLGAGVGIGGQTLYVGEARKKLKEAEKNVGDFFFENDFMTDDQEMKELTFEVASRQEQVRTAAIATGLLVGLTDINPDAGGVSMEDVSSSTEPSTVESVTPPTPEVEIEELPESPSVTEMPAAEEGYSSEKLTDEVDNFEKNSDSDKLDNNTGVDSSVGRAEGEVSEPSRSSGSGVDRVDTTTESASEANDVTPEVTKDYSLPTFSSVNDLPSQGIVESVPQAPAEIPAVSQDPNLTPMTESEATATFGPVTGPSVEGLTTPEPVIHTVEKGENVWNIMEGKGPDANPVGGKSEVLEGMSLTERHDALDKLVEYAEQNPEFAKEVGAVRSNGNIHMIYPESIVDGKVIPADQINISMLDDKLRELLGIGETAPEPVATPEATVPAEEVGEVEVQPEPVAEQVAEEPEAAPEPVPVSPQPESSDAPVYESGSIINASMSSDGASSSAAEAAPVTPEPVATNTNEIAVNSYVAGVEKATGGFLDSLMGLGQPNVGGTFELIKGLNLNDMVTIAQSGQLPEGVSQVGWDRWVDHINDSIAKSPINAGETIGQYITRVASTRIA